MHPGRLGALPDASEVARTTWRRFQIDFKSSGKMLSWRFKLVARLSFQRILLAARDRERVLLPSESDAVRCCFWVFRVVFSVGPRGRTEALNGEPNPAKWTKWSTKVENEVERFY